MDYKDKYNEWLAFADENTKAELESITDEKLAFDHNEIILEGLLRLKNKILWVQALTE